MPKKKYILDSTTLQFLQHKLAWTDKLIRVAAFFGVSILLTFFYVFVFNHLFGSPKEKILNERLAELKFQYSLIDRRIENNRKILADLRSTDNSSYRPVLDLPLIPETSEEGGSGGVDKYGNLSGFDYSDLMVATDSKLEDLKTQTNIQYNSFNELTTKANDWKTMWDHLPYFRPVDMVQRVGDGYHFRDKHPVLGIGRWHFGQDFPCPSGTKVYATGGGKVVFAGNDGDGFGNKIIIDHGFGYKTIYGHLSRINIKAGDVVNRGDKIGLSGTTGISSGPHLHYQIELYGQPVNPLSYLSNELTEEEYFKILGVQIESDSSKK
ncbi:MAG TPA: M23 family metallopeptidase [Bacteroidales bacterium]|nr:M23 family metallopeptidase [Bacteroidales bacterium]